MLQRSSGPTRTLLITSESLTMLSALHYKDLLFWHLQSADITAIHAFALPQTPLVSGKSAIPGLWLQAAPEVLEVICLHLRASKLGKRLCCDGRGLSGPSLVQEDDCEVLDSLPQPTRCFCWPHCLVSWATCQFMPLVSVRAAYCMPLLSRGYGH